MMGSRSAFRLRPMASQDSGELLGFRKKVRSDLSRSSSRTEHPERGQIETIVMPGDNNHNGTQRTHGDPGHLIAWDGDLSTVPLPGQPDHPVAPVVDPQAINGFASTVSQPAEPPGVDLEGTIAASSSLRPLPAAASEAAPEGDRAAPGYPWPGTDREHSTLDEP